jgi:hypothetical protein
MMGWLGHSRTLRGPSQREIDRDGTLADTAFPGSHGHDVLDALERREATLDGMRGDVCVKLQLERWRGEPRFFEVMTQRRRQLRVIPVDRQTELERHAQPLRGGLDGTYRTGFGQRLAQIRLEIAPDFGFERRLIKGLGHGAILAARAATRRVAVR